MLMDLMANSIAQMLGSLSISLSVLSWTWWIMFPPLLWWLFINLWMRYRVGTYLGSINWTLLELISPRDIEKSPQPMESLFIAMSGILSTPNTLEEYLDGKVTPSFSLEMVSDEGSVHFYIHTPTMFRNLVESHLYAQYPGMEIVEVPDYIHNIPKNIPNQKWDLWGTDFVLCKPDPYPIKTYRRFEEDITGTMIDPLAGLIETMGRIGPGEKIWFQYITTPLGESWYSEGQELVNQLTGKAKKKKASFFGSLVADTFEIIASVPKGLLGPVEFSKASAEKKDEAPLEFRLTPGEREVLKALEENIGKNVYKIKMRFIYLAEKEFMDKTHVSAFIGGLKQFADQNLNSFKPDSVSKTSEAFIGKKGRLRFKQRQILDRYKTRDDTGKKFILSSEELATVFHLPDQSVLAPATPRVEARRGSAPGNLPIQ